MTNPDNLEYPADLYSQYRPTYPSELFELIRDKTSSHDFVVEVGCGTGQATKNLSQIFGKVLASDYSQTQLKKAPAIDNVTFVCSPAESIPVESNSANCLVSAQAAHWFDHKKFFVEVERVTKKPASLFLATYDVPVIENSIVEEVHRVYADKVSSYFAAGREHIYSRYQTIVELMPWDDVKIHLLPMPFPMTKEQFEGYLESYSARINYIKQNGEDPIIPLKEGLLKSWPKNIERLTVNFPLTVVEVQLKNSK